MEYDISKANRESGSWVVGECPYRAIPCGNPTCVDEAMRAGMVYQDNTIARATSDHALKRAQKQVRTCAEENHQCPLGNLEEGLDLLERLYSKFKE